MDKHRLAKAITGLAAEKGISKDDVMSTIAETIKTIARKKYSLESDEIRVDFDKETMDYKIFKILEESEEELPQIDLNRVGAQVAKQVIHRTVSNAARSQVIERYGDQVGTNTMAIVRRIERNGDVFLDIGATEAIMPRQHCLPGEKYSVNERVSCIIESIREHGKGPYIVLSRADIGFVINLLHSEVSDIANGYINIESASRQPGIKTKIIVSSNDAGVNPIGTIVGPGGSRIQNISTELRGERIDVVALSDLDTMIRNLLKPAILNKIIINDASDIIEVILSEEEMPKAIGKFGSNIKLTCEVLDKEVKLLSPKQEMELDEQDFNIFYNNIKDIELSDIERRTLYNLGFYTLYDIAYSDKDLLIENNINPEIIGKSEEVLLKKHNSKTLLSITSDIDVIGLLVQSGIDSCEQLADLTSDEIGIDSLDIETINTLIMDARKACNMI